MKSVTLKDDKQRLLRVLVHIQSRLDEPLPLDELAHCASFSPFHFHRIFKGMVGESVQGHIRRLRLERAAARLKRGRQTVTEIAFEAGYDTHEAFTRAFKATFGLPPSRYRSLSTIPERPFTTQSPSGVHYSETISLKEFKTKETKAKTMNVTIKRIEPLLVAFVRHVGPYESCGEAWGRLCGFLGQAGLLANARFLGISHDDPDVTTPEKLRYDACVTVDDAFQPQGEIGVQTVAGGDYAVATHLGPYQRLNETYAQLMGQWLPHSGRELRSAPCFEVYLNDPDRTPAEKLLTEIHVPLEA